MFLGPTVLAADAVTHTQHHTQTSVEYNVDLYQKPVPTALA